MGRVAVRFICSTAALDSYVNVDQKCARVEARAPGHQDRVGQESGGEQSGQSMMEGREDA